MSDASPPEGQPVSVEVELADVESMLERLDELDEASLDALPFGLIKLDLKGTVLAFNRTEAELPPLRARRRCPGRRRSSGAPRLETPMNDLLNEAGWTAYPLLLTAMASGGLGLVALALAAAKALRPALVVAGVAMGLAFVGVLGGRLGYHDGLRGSYKAVAHAAPEDRAIILEGSEREARSAITLGLFSLPGGLLGALAVGLSFARTGDKR